MKLKAAFASAGGLNGAGLSFTFVGPDPDTGNALAGFSFGGGTDTWNLGINYDWIRGNNASTTQVGTLTLLGDLTRRGLLPAECVARAHVRKHAPRDASAHAQNPSRPL